MKSDARRGSKPAREVGAGMRGEGGLIMGTAHPAD
jgi:hypothetical protein